MKRRQLRYLALCVIFFFFLANRTPNYAAAVEISFKSGDEFLYKNEHYLLDAQGQKTLERTKWSRIVIDNVAQSEDASVLNVTWSKFDVENVSLAEIDANPSLWRCTLPGYPSSMRADTPLTRFQALFNAKDAQMSELPKEILLGTYKLFYSTEYGYFNKWVQNRTVNNTKLYDNRVPTISIQKTRVFEAFLDCDAKIRLNWTYPDIADAFYEIKLNLKLYLVYGQESNILLSYNINFTIAETEYGQADKILRKIIFWNIRRPIELTKDYPLAEMFEGVDSSDPVLICGAMGLAMALSVRNTRSKKREGGNLHGN